MLNSHCASGGLRKDESEDARRRKCKAAGVALKRTVSVSCEVFRYQYTNQISATSHAMMKGEDK
jgi:hypothetical protein